MLDIETTGFSPDKNSIIQIAAAGFDIESGKIAREFNQCLSPLPDREWDQSTLCWWEENNKHLFNHIKYNERDPKTVIKEFDIWIQNFNDDQVIIWSKPTWFDIPFIVSYFRQFEIDLPFNRRYAMDVNTCIFSDGIDDLETYWDNIEFVGKKHNAMDDVKHQIKGLLLM